VNWINSLLEKKLADEFKEFVLSSLRTELSWLNFAIPELSLPVILSIWWNL
jgi:hypothetical protein